MSILILLMLRVVNPFNLPLGSRHPAVSSQVWAIQFRNVPLPRLTRRSCAAIWQLIVFDFRLLQQSFPYADKPWLRSPSMLHGFVIRASGNIACRRPHIRLGVIETKLKLINVACSTNSSSSGSPWASQTIFGADHSEGTTYRLFFDRRFEGFEAASHMSRLLVIHRISRWPQSLLGSHL